MPITAEEIALAIRERLLASHVEVQDVSGGADLPPGPIWTIEAHHPTFPLSDGLGPFPSGCGSAFDVIIVSSAFEGKRILERHKLVNAALKTELAEVRVAAVHVTLTSLGRTWSVTHSPQSYFLLSFCFQIHAFSIKKASTPDEFAAAQGNAASGPAPMAA